MERVGLACAKPREQAQGGGVGGVGNQQGALRPSVCEGGFGCKARGLLCDAVALGGAL